MCKPIAKGFFTHASFMALLIVASLPAISQAQSVQLDSGQAEGVTLPTGVRAWYGIPFAKAPVRELRWKAPLPAAPWQGVYHADRPAPMCLQALRARTMNHYFGNEAISEDCLYVNIWAPKDPAPAGKPYPVVVWIYGGGFTVGSASMANYSGEHLAQKGVIQVNIAYRLGVLGFLSHPELSAESGTHSSGNYGLMDQIFALKWIQKNIAAFGGDPSKVTIAGQSAGSMSVSLLQASPLTKGLFQGAVGMSGSAMDGLMTPQPLTDAEADGLRLQQALNAGGIEAMRDLAADKILSVPFARKSPIAIDGLVLTDAPAATFAAHKQNDVPIMIGFTHDEGFMSLGAIKSLEDYKTAIAKAFPDTAEAILKAYPAKGTAEAATQARLIARDATLGRMTDGWANAQARSATKPAYVWMFTRRQPYALGITFADHDPATVGAYHTGDVPYWLETYDSLNLFRKTRDWGATDVKLADEMSDLLVNFARTGVPSASSLPAWPVYSAKKPQMLQLGEDIQVINWPNAKALPLLAAPKPTAPPPAANRPRD
jgi:para-nitrobenzyl esterase